MWLYRYKTSTLLCSNSHPLDPRGDFFCGELAVALVRAAGALMAHILDRAHDNPQRVRHAAVERLPWGATPADPLV